MYKIRIIAFALILALFVPIVAVPVQVKADSNVTDFSRLAGTAAPVLTAITSCALNLLFNKAYVTTKSKVDAAESIMDAPVYIGDGTEVAAYNQNLTALQNQKKALCLVPIERAAAQVILNTITTETINWINGGMNGQPLYSQNLGASLGDMQNNALVKLAADLSDPNSYPFGKDILKAALATFHTTYQQSSVSDINATIGANFPGKSLKDFSNNLLLGGWGAFDSGFKPNNNAIGFNFQTQDHMIAQLQGTAYSQAQALKDQLNWGHGFLSQTKCSDPSFDPTLATTTLDTITGKMSDSHTVIQNVCQGKTIVTTPGDTISASLSKALGSQTDALNLGQNLDASITSIFNAMITKLLQNGLTSLSDDTGNNSNADTTSDTNSGAAQQATITGNATAGSLCGVNSSTDWWNQFPQFDLYHDLVNNMATSTDSLGNIVTVTNPGLITREQQLKYVLVDQDNVIQWIEKAIYTADLCIPGPSSLSDTNIKNKIYGNIMQIYNYPGSDVDQVNEIYNAQFLSDNLGIRYFPNDKLKSPSAVQKIIKTVISRYYDALMSEYGNLNLIQSYSKVQDYYGKLASYEQQEADNQAKIGLIDGTTAQLNTIESGINNTTNDYNNGKLTSTQEAARLEKIKEQFEALIPDLDVSPYISKK